MEKNQLKKIFDNQENIFNYHKMNLSGYLLKFIKENTDTLGIIRPNPNLNEHDSIKYYYGEYLAMLSRITGIVAANLLFTSKWSEYFHPDWFDHRLHDLFPEEYDHDYAALSATEVLKKLPYKGNMLSLASGDGYYEYKYYRLRAAEIDCIEIQDECLTHAKLYHSDNNINYQKGNILEADYGTAKYDVISIRGAIEHFSRENQQIIFKKAKNALKDDGWFCGDTPQAAEYNIKHLEEHECEWKSEEEMIKSLSNVFSVVKTFSYKSDDRTTLFWTCQK